MPISYAYTIVDLTECDDEAFGVQYGKLLATSLNLAGVKPFDVGDEHTDLFLVFSVDRYIARPCVESE